MSCAERLSEVERRGSQGPALDRRAAFRITCSGALRAGRSTLCLIGALLVGVLFEISIVCLVFCVCGLFCLFLVCFGEFDPGSGRTLAACLTHASRTGFWGSGFFGWGSGG